MSIRWGIGLFALLMAAGVGAEVKSVKNEVSREHQAETSLSTATAGLERRGPPANFCLQEMWQDLSGSNDLFVCLYRVNTCSEDGEIELWYGNPTHDDLPHTCTQSSSCQCEPADIEVNKQSGNTWAKKVPGHGKSYNSTTAWREVEDALEKAAQEAEEQGLELDWHEPQFHEIASNDTPAEFQNNGASLLVMAVPVVGTYPTSETYFLCLQIDSLDLQSDHKITPMKVETKKVGHGKQFRIKYRVNERYRTGLVWLK